MRRSERRQQQQSLSRTKRWWRVCEDQSREKWRGSTISTRRPQALVLHVAEGSTAIIASLRPLSWPPGVLSVSLLHFIPLYPTIAIHHERQRSHRARSHQVLCARRARHCYPGMSAGSTCSGLRRGPSLCVKTRTGHRQLDQCASRAQHRTTQELKNTHTDASAVHLQAVSLRTHHL